MIVFDWHIDTMAWIWDTSKKSDIDALARYPYPLFHVLTTAQRVALFTGSGITCAVSTVGLKWLYGKINGIDRFQKEALNPIKVD